MEDDYKIMTIVFAFYWLCLEHISSIIFRFQTLHCNGRLYSYLMFRHLHWIFFKKPCLTFDYLIFMILYWMSWRCNLSLEHENALSTKGWKGTHCRWSRTLDCLLAPPGDTFTQYGMILGWYHNPSVFGHKFVNF